MNATFILTLALFCQEPHQLNVGESAEGLIGESSERIQTPTLDANYASAPTRGAKWRLRVEESGPYTMELRSYDFDAYLVLWSADGSIVGEDDDGLISTHARLAVELEAGKEYRVGACALHGLVGEFHLVVRAGHAEALAAADRWQVEAAETEARIEHLRNKFGDDSLEVAEALNQYGIASYQSGHYPEAQAAMEAALEIYERVLGPDHPNTARSLSNLAGFLTSQGKYAEALPLHQRVLGIVETALGPEHPNTAFSLNNLAYLYYSQGNLQEAWPLFERALSIRQKILGPDHPDTSMSLNNLATLLHDIGQSKEARLLHEHALAIREKTLGPSHPLTAMSLNNLANLLQSLGNLEEARPMFQRGLDIRVQVLGRKHPDCIKALNNLAMLDHAQGRYSQARIKYEETVALSKEVYGAEHPETAVFINNLAGLHRDLGSHEKAKVLFEQALVILHKALGAEHPRTVKGMNNLANLFSAQGNDAEAYRLYTEALEIRKRVLGAEHPDTLTGEHGLGVLLHSQGKYPEAQPVLERVLEARQRVLGGNHPETVNSLNSLGVLLVTMGALDQALPLYQEALTVRERVLGPLHPDTAATLSNLASLLQKLDRFDEALPMHKRALAIWKANLGEDHPNISKSWAQLAGFHARQGNAERAHQCLHEALSSALRYLDRELPTLSESERLRLLEISAHPENFLGGLGALESPPLENAFALYLQWKGKATRLLEAGVRLGQEGDLEENRRLKGGIQSLGKELSELVLLPLDKQGEDHAERVGELRVERLRLERDFHRQIGLDQTLTTPSPAELQQRLPEKSVLIDFFVGDQVFAWVLQPQGAPQLIPLGPAAVIREAQENVLRSMALIRGGITMAAVDADSDSLEQLVWQPLLDAVGGAETVFLCPDGFLCELPFGMIQLDDATYLLEKHRFHYLSDPTRLAQRKQGEGDGEGPILAVGGINYFRRDGSPTTSPRSAAYRSRVGDSWNSLPATRDEIQSLVDLHDFILEWKAPMTVVDGGAATEERVREELPNHRYVHIATHGYFEPDNLPSLLLDAELKNTQVDLGEQIQAVGLLPGLLSGLVFAGVNGEADPGRDDGYLSAEEIQHLDLSTCDLVVLSACETALGSPRAGEGLMSLRRSFAVAGAETVISSLWKVDDQASARLMRDFYNNLWAKNMNRGEALHLAKLRMLLRNRIDNAGDARPSTWAAFVLSGDWN